MKGGETKRDIAVKWGAGTTNRTRVTTICRCSTHDDKVPNLVCGRGKDCVVTIEGELGKLRLSANP